jgi:hypothetical protein
MSIEITKDVENGILPRPMRPKNICKANRETAARL